MKPTKQSDSVTRRRICFVRPVVIAFAAGACAGAGCGGEESGAAGDAGATATVGAIASTLHGDLMTPQAAPSSAAGETGELASAQSALSGGSGAGPKVFYLDYADGTTRATGNFDACNGTAPAFNCQFGSSLLDCQRQVQTYLDKWFADFNIIFTLTRPTSGKYYTEVVSSGGGAWCNVADSVAGVAPFLCKDLSGGVAYTFEGGRTAKETAVIIAQEGAHLVGLEHSSSPHDIMYPYICSDCDGFPNVDNPVTGDRCDRETQNSYKMLMDALGPWPGGPKPSAFGCMDDTSAPTVRFVTPHDGAAMGHDFSVQVDVHDDCAVANVDITVMPQGLSARSKTPPFQWDLTGINGAQTITVIASDGNGHSGTATLSITAPAATESTGDDGAGCTVASGAFGAAGLLPSLAMLFIFSGRHRRSRRRRVTGALSRM
jgi:hypothetical protein